MDGCKRDAHQVISGEDNSTPSTINEMVQKIRHQAAARTELTQLLDHNT